MSCLLAFSALVSSRQDPYFRELREAEKVECPGKERANLGALGLSYLVHAQDPCVICFGSVGISHQGLLMAVPGWYRSQ